MVRERLALGWANAVAGLRPGCHKAARQAAWQKNKAMAETKPGASMGLP